MAVTARIPLQLEPGPGDIPATGKSVKVSGMSDVRYEGGKIADETLYFDQLDFNQQLGYTMTPPTAAALAAPTK